MLKIGITGGIGSGKSSICNVFKCLGVPVFSSDAVSKELLDTEPAVKEALIFYFGSKVLDDSGMLNRKALAEIVFSQPEALKKLNALMHPLVKSNFLAWCNVHKEAPYILKEAAILIESGAYKDVDAILVVHATENKRIMRVMERDKVARILVELRIKRQMPESEKLAKADYIIYNDDCQMVLPQVLKLHQFFQPIPFI